MPEPSSRNEVLRQAAEWFAVLHADETGDDERKRWRDWLQADPQHASAWQRVESMSRRFADLPAVVDRRAASHALGAARSRRGSLKLLAATAVGGGLSAWFAAQQQPWQRWTASHRTGVGEQLDVRLADGTHIWLNTDTAVKVDYTGNHRHLRLLKGEVMVETAPDMQSPARPFAVHVDEGSLHPLGTRFTVNRGGDACHLAVFAGAVEIRRPGVTAVHVVHAGRQSRFDRRGVAAVEAADPRREAWTRSVLLADNMPLADFVAELSRYQHGFITCTPEVAGLRLVGAYPLAQPEQIYRALARSLPVRVSRPMPWWVRIEAA